MSDSTTPSVQDNGKTIAIVAHITLIGWIVAIIMNNQNKTEFGSFYIRQMLGLVLMGLLGLIPFLGLLISLLVLVLWIVSLVNAASDKMTPIPIVGPLFQEWFKSM